MSEEFDAVVAEIRDRVTPTPAERDRLGAAVTDLVDRTERALADLSVEAEIVQVGSTARDTWLAGDRDIDLFVCFPPSIDREQLEEYGLAVGHAVLPDGHEEYAEHPYVVGEFDGFDVDLVPCYAVEAATDIQSAVDRTPFHTRYLESRIDTDLAAEIRVCKQFFTGIGVYGSDLHTRGFSGFLTELLVCEHGGFEPLLAAAADWHPPVRFDPADHGRREFDDPLVVIDPTDPERNVAAVCSAENVARLQHYAREMLADPRVELFDPREPDPVDPETVRDAIAARETTPVAVRFEAPEIVDDQLWPQLEKSRTGIAEALDRRGFDVLRTAAFVARDVDDAVLLFELEVASRPAVERHEGPPVHVREHATDFYETYADTDACGPFVDGDRYVVEREREQRSAETFLASEAIFEAGLGTHVESVLRTEYDVLAGADVADLAASFGTDLAGYLDPRP